MLGTSRLDGKPLSGLEHLKQSIADILTTPKGTRVMRREYGSELPRLVDRPNNQVLEIDLYAETVIALSRWEPRLKVNSVSITQRTESSIELSMVATYLPDGREIRIEGIVVR